MTERTLLERAWGLATLPMAHTSYTQSVLQFLRVGGAVCPQRSAMFELALEIRMMRGSFDVLLAAWRPRRRRADTAPGNPRAMRGAA